MKVFRHKSAVRMTIIATSLSLAVVISSCTTVINETTNDEQPDDTV